MFLAQPQHGVLAFCPKESRVAHGQAVQSPLTFTFWARTKDHCMEIPGGFWASSLFNAVRWIPDSFPQPYQHFCASSDGHWLSCDCATKPQHPEEQGWSLGDLAAPCCQNNYLLWIFFCALIAASEAAAAEVTGWLETSPGWHSWGFLTDFSPNLCKKLHENEGFVQIWSQTCWHWGEEGLHRLWIECLRGCTNSELSIWGAAVPLCSRVRASALCLLLHRLRLLPAFVAVFFWISRKEEN